MLYCEGLWCVMMLLSIKDENTKQTLKSLTEPYIYNIFKKIFS